MVIFRIVLQGEIVRTLVQILQAQQGANRIGERELVADHNVGGGYRSWPSIAEKPQKIKLRTGLGSSGRPGSGSRRELQVSEMQRGYLCLQRFEAVVIMNHIVRLAQSLLSGGL